MMILYTLSLSRKVFSQHFIFRMARVILYIFTLMGCSILFHDFLGNRCLIIFILPPVNGGGLCSGQLARLLIQQFELEFC